MTGAGRRKQKLVVNILLYTIKLISHDVVKKKIYPNVDTTQHDAIS